jgi:glycosyltransferase involved in cell wall biosynthesis
MARPWNSNGAKPLMPCSTLEFPCACHVENRAEDLFAMKVALDATPLTAQKSGIGEYTYQLARRLALRHPQDEILLVSNFPFPPVTGIPNLSSKYCKTNWISGRWWLVGLARFLEREGVSVFHGTDYSVPMLPLLPSVLTIHDLSSVRLSHLHERRTRRTARRLPRMVRMAAHVVVPSATVREEIIEQYNLREENVSVIPLAPGPQFCTTPESDQEVQEKYGLHQPYVLFVGTLEPRKNLSTLVKAFAALPHEILADTQLALCGRWGWMNDELQAEIKRLQPTKSLHVTGYVPDSDLPALYRGATVFAYPSLYEGFGLPPLEAMACGVPVIASTAAALTEVLGDAAERVDPLDIEAWSQRLLSMLSDAQLRESYVRRGLSHVKKFCWDAAAEQTYAVYLKILSDYCPGGWERIYRAMLDWVPAAR